LAAAALCLEASRDRKPEPLETPQAITATILRLEELLDEAESHHRVDAVEKLIADDYRGVSVGGGMIVHPGDAGDGCRGSITRLVPMGP
jgi:hypothetical protein